MIFKIFIFFLATSISAFAEIKECAAMNEVLREASQKTLFIFDIDNTILRPRQTLGSDEWVDNYMKKLKNEGVSNNEIERSVLDMWSAIHVVTKVRLIEKETPSVIETLQKNHSVIILTSRPEYSALSTMHQLESCKIDASKSSPLQTTLLLKNGPRTMVFREGIIYTWGQSKGEALVEFLNHLQEVPSKIVVVDDKRRHLDCIEEALKKFYPKIACIGFRYGAADSIVTSYDPSIAQEELECFKDSLLSDDEAKEDLMMPLAS